MSRILDELAKVEKRQRPKLFDGPGNDNGPGINDSEWLTVTGASSRTCVKADGERLARKKRLRFCHGAGLVVAVLAGMGLDRYPAQQISPVRSRQVKATAATGSLPASVVIDKAMLSIPLMPSCIPLDAEDFEYASKHHGWRKFQTEAREFRVFTERGAVKAIQVLACQEPLNGRFLDTFMKQVAGTKPYEITSREKKGGYLIEKGRLGRWAEVVTYRNILADEIRALVVVYLP